MRKHLFATAGLLFAICGLRQAAAAPVPIVPIASSLIENVYYYHGRYYPYHYGRGYYGHRYYRYGRWHYY